MYRKESLTVFTCVASAVFAALSGRTRSEIWLVYDTPSVAGSLLA